MKKLLIVSASVAALSFGEVHQAYALFGVGDIVNDPELNLEQKLSNALTASSWVTQARDMIKAYGMLTNQYNQLVTTYSSITSGRIVSDIAPELGMLRAPTSPSMIQSDLGFGQNLMGRAAGLAQQNRVYTPQGTDFGAREIQRQSNATANFQSEAQCEMQAVEARQASLQAFINREDNSKDLQSTGAIQNRLQLEQSFLANERAKLQALTMNIVLASRVDQQRMGESDRQDADNWRTNTNSAWGTQW